MGSPTQRSCGHCSSSELHPSPEPQLFLVCGKFTALNLRRTAPPFHVLSSSRGLHASTRTGFLPHFHPEGWRETERQRQRNGERREGRVRGGRERERKRLILDSLFLYAMPLGFPPTSLEFQAKFLFCYETTEQTNLRSSLVFWEHLYCTKTAIINKYIWVGDRGRRVSSRFTHSQVRTQIPNRAEILKYGGYQAAGN